MFSCESSSPSGGSSLISLPSRAPYSRRNIKQFLSDFTEKATDGSLQSEDWTLNMEICDIINETEEGYVFLGNALSRFGWDSIHSLSGLSVLGSTLVLVCFFNYYFQSVRFGINKLKFSHLSFPTPAYPLPHGSASVREVRPLHHLL